MTEAIAWETEMDAALGRAKSENKPIFLDFFNPNWIGCQQMDAVTYPQDNVIEFINKNVIALQLAFDMQPLASDFSVKWTPVLAVLDAQGKAHQQTVGFFSAQELVPSLMLGSAKVHFAQDNFEKALVMLHALQADYPGSVAVPEAIFMEGVCRYKHSQNAKTLKDAYEQLQADFPGNDWTHRASPYRLL